ncbi:MAG: AMP-binding protein, partial [Cyclobacteriaceae bacterium]|nr:AMP-binding protein [Cyclobacteriaceae bacterium]
MSFQLHINNRVYSKNEVLKTTDRGFVIDFCKKWLKGTSSFKITSSGSTGSPKLLNIQRSQMITSARKTIEYFKLHKGTQAVLCMDPKFIGGMMMLVRALEGEWVLHVLTPAANPFIGNKSLPSFDFISLVPLQLREIIETGHGLELIQQARVVLVGGAEVGPWLTTRCLQLKPAIYSTYGMTETLSHIAVRQINGSNPDESFTTLPGIEIKSNEAGCLTICGDITFGKELVTRDRVEITESGQFKVL